jgi:hypothetical protein
MKSHNSVPRPKGAGYRGRSPMRISPIPMEWMDPMSWRLPSGKALAEFWLQSGFLAPLMLGGPAIKKRKVKVTEASPIIAEKSGKEVPGHSGTFRHTR